jgi:hypothetical protein
METRHTTTAVIHLDRLTANIRLLQKLAGDCPMWPAVRAVMIATSGG